MSRRLDISTTATFIILLFVIFTQILLRRTINQGPYVNDKSQDQCFTRAIKNQNQKARINAYIVIVFERELNVQYVIHNLFHL